MEKFCLNCGKKFVTLWKWQKFCSYECKLIFLQKTRIRYQAKKTCHNCGKEFFVERTKNGTKFCKDCIKKHRRKMMRKYALKHYNLHKERVTSLQRISRENLKFSVLAIYSEGNPKCACCGESHMEFLSIDHIYGGGNQHRKKIGRYGGYQFYVWLARNNFPEEYQSMCMNCQCAKRGLKKQFCPVHHPELYVNERLL